MAEARDTALIMHSGKLENVVHGGKIYLIRFGIVALLDR
jgi:hypothetical protein